MLEATIQGNLGGEPTFKQFQADRAVLNFSVGCYTGKDRDTGESKTTWVRVAIWGAMAERLAGVLHTGTGVLCRGRLELREYTHQTTGEVRQSLDMTASTVLPVRVDWGAEQQQAAAPARKRQQVTAPPPAASTDHVPF